jgi:alpha-glucosidase (family GH31 glycosyl hydrolase)
MIVEKGKADRTVTLPFKERDQFWFDFYDDSGEYVGTIKVTRNPDRTVIFIQHPSRVVLQQEILKLPT